MQLQINSTDESKAMFLIELLQKIKTTLQTIYAQRLAKVILFGSYARNEATENSDIDIAIILYDNEMSLSKELELLSKNFIDLVLQSDKVIAKIPITLQRFENSNSLFIRNIRKDGIEI